MRVFWIFILSISFTLTYAQEDQSTKCETEGQTTGQEQLQALAANMAKIQGYLYSSKEQQYSEVEGEGLSLFWDNFEGSGSSLLVKMDGKGGAKVYVGKKSADGSWDYYLQSDRQVLIDSKLLGNKTIAVKNGMAHLCDKGTLQNCKQLSKVSTELKQDFVMAIPGENYHRTGVHKNQLLAAKQLRPSSLSGSVLNQNNLPKPLAQGTPQANTPQITLPQGAPPQVSGAGTKPNYLNTPNLQLQQNNKPLQTYPQGSNNGQLRPQVIPQSQIYMPGKQNQQLPQGQNQGLPQYNQGSPNQGLNNQGYQGLVYPGQLTSIQEGKGSVRLNRSDRPRPSFRDVPNVRNVEWNYRFAARQMDPPHNAANVQMQFKTPPQGPLWAKVYAGHVKSDFKRNNRWVVVPATIQGNKVSFTVPGLLPASVYNIKVELHRRQSNQVPAYNQLGPSTRVVDFKKTPYWAVTNGTGKLNKARFYVATNNLVEHYDWSIRRANLRNRERDYVWINRLNGWCGNVIHYASRPYVRIKSECPTREFRAAGTLTRNGSAYVRDASRRPAHGDWGFDASNRYHKYSIIEVSESGKMYTLHGGSENPRTANYFWKVYGARNIDQVGTLNERMLW